jgi:curved DNA-binding protein CbpA
MKFDSPYFDRIRVKPGADRRMRTKASHVCEWPGCQQAGTHLAPKGRGREHEKWRYCLDHVREYNQSYNYFSGMSDADVLRFQKDALTGHRPTWKMGAGRSGEPGHFYAEGAQDPFVLFRELGGHGPSERGSAAKKETRTIRNAERKAFFHDLVKRHHPDANGGDRSTEDRLIEIIQSYNYLKSVGLC